MAKKRTGAWDSSANAAANAKRVLPRLAARFFRTGRKLVAAGGSYEKLHAFRLDAKRFRYTLELFQPLYGQGLERRLAALREIQQYLGEINDCVTTRSLLEKMGVRQSKRADHVFGFLDREAARIARRFCKYWKETFDLPERERQWSDYLNFFAGRHRKAGRETRSGALRKPSS